MLMGAKGGRRKGGGGCTNRIAGVDLCPGLGLILADGRAGAGLRLAPAL